MLHEVYRRSEEIVQKTKEETEPRIISLETQISELVESKEGLENELSRVSHMLDDKISQCLESEASLERMKDSHHQELEACLLNLQKVKTNYNIFLMIFFIKLSFILSFMLMLND